MWLDTFNEIKRAAKITETDIMLLLLAIASIFIDFNAKIHPMLVGSQWCGCFMSWTKEKLVVNEQIAALFINFNETTNELSL